jgi:hypothetical protein
MICTAPRIIDTGVLAVFNTLYKNDVISKLIASNHMEMLVSMYLSATQRISPHNLSPNHNSKLSSSLHLVLPDCGHWQFSLTVDLGPLQAEHCLVLSIDRFVSWIEHHSG